MEKELEKELKKQNLKRQDINLSCLFEEIKEIRDKLDNIIVCKYDVIIDKAEDYNIDSTIVEKMFESIEDAYMHSRRVLKNIAIKIGEIQDLIDNENN